MARDEQLRLGSSFGAAAAAYAEHRPDYSPTALRWALASAPGPRVLDLGDGEYVAVSKRDGDLGDFVYVWTAPEPYGPWTPQKGIAAPAGFDTGELKYAPLAHPEVPLANGKLLVSISRNTTDPQRLFDDPEVGVPEFAQVPRP